jgi:transposase-like protein
MARKASPDNPACPHCQGNHVTKNGHKDGQPRWLCHACRKTFVPTYDTPLYRLRASAPEVARGLRVILRRGSLNAAEEIAGHKYETLGEWLRQAAEHSEAVTAVLVHDLPLTAVETDAFWSFVKKNSARQTRRSRTSRLPVPPRLMRAPSHRRPLHRQRTTRAPAGGASQWIGQPASLSPGVLPHRKMKRPLRWWP